MKKDLLKTVAYCPPECVVLRQTLSTGFMQGSNFVQSETMETYNDMGDDDSNWN